MLLMLLVLVPLSAGLLCLTTVSRAWWERLNLAAFAVVAGLSLHVGNEVLAHGPVSAFDGGEEAVAPLS